MYKIFLKYFLGADKDFSNDLDMGEFYDFIFKENSALN
jgi:hypothetical protein